MLQIRKQGLVLTLTLDRSESMNAFNGELFDALTEALLEAANDVSTRVVILTGAGRAFSAGLDLNEVGRDVDPPKHGIPGLFNALIEFPKPLLLAINGPGLGFGATIVGLADMAFIATSARLRCPFTSLGVVGEAGSTFTFPRLMGDQASRWMLYSSAWMDAQECVRTGLVLDVFPDESLLEEVMQRAQVIAATSPLALIRSKELMMGPIRAALRAAIDAETAVFDELMGSPDNLEAFAAFREKRTPQFLEVPK